MPYKSMEFNIDTVGWVPSIERDDYPALDELGIRVNGTPTGSIEFMYSEVPGASWNQAKLDAAQQIAQDLVDVRTPLTDLPAEHPWRLADPGLGNPDSAVFWDAGDLVFRDFRVTDFVWNDRLDWTSTKLRIP
jgi:hypothetical protein